MSSTVASLQNTTLNRSLGLLGTHLSVSLHSARPVLRTAVFTHGKTVHFSLVLSFFAWILVRFSNPKFESSPKLHRPFRGVQPPTLSHPKADTVQDSEPEHLAAAPRGWPDLEHLLILLPLSVSPRPTTSSCLVVGRNGGALSRQWRGHERNACAGEGAASREGCERLRRRVTGSRRQAKEGRVHLLRVVGCFSSKWAARGALRLVFALVVSLG